MSVPANIEAEEAVLGACMISEMAIEDAAAALEPLDFYRPLHQHIFDAILHLSRTSQVDAITVGAVLRKAGLADDEQIRDLSRLYANTPTLSVGNYCRLITEARVQRDLIMASAEIAKLANVGDEESLDKARMLLDGIRTPRVGVTPDRDLHSFIEETDTKFNWLVPGFLEHGDRLIFTAAEGYGKSTLMRQLALQLASGTHPWTLKTIAPSKVLFVDCENKPASSARQFDRMHKGLVYSAEMLTIVHRRTGMDLSRRADRAWLIERVEANQAEVLIIGPLYKLMAGTAERGDSGGEDFTRGITGFFDQLIERTGATLITEAHAPHAGIRGRDLRPAGSSVWMRWPDMGVGLRPDKNDQSKAALEHWRGGREREARNWPDYLCRGSQTRWPWEAAWKTRPTFGPEGVAEAML